MTHEITTALSLLFSPGQTVEVRAFRNHGTASGYFTDFQKLAGKAEVLDSTGEFWGIYVTLNPVNPVLLSRRANRVETRIGKNDSLTADTDIVTRRWLPIDIDPVRPSGVSSSDQEHEAAIKKAGRIGAFLSERGWPAPLIADSGNGAHLLYRIDLPNDDASRDLVKRCLEVLSVVFSDGVCTVDTSNHNAARIWKLYGTVSRKGDHTEDRPHRRSRVIEPGSQLTVSREMLEQLTTIVPSNPPPPPPTEQKSYTPGSIIDLREWLTRYGIGFSGEKPHQGGTIYPLDECPFSMAHKDGAYAIQFGNGAIFAGCHHNSCGGGQQRWQELREKYEPDRHAKWKEWEEKEKQWNRERGRLRAERDGLLETAARHVEGPQPAMSEGGQGPGTAPATPLPSGANANSTHGGEPATPQKSTHADLQGGVPASTPAHVSNDLPGKEEALALLKCGDPVKEMLACFAKDHVGDEVVAECLILSLASRSVLNTNGLHVSVTGESGKGKSHTFSTMLKQVPPRYRLSCRMSNKALFYIDDLQPGTAIVFDDTTLSDEMGEILKGVTTSFREPFLYRTVTKDRRGQICTIPERCVWWVAKVEGVGDDQVFNRMLTCWIDDTIEQDGRVLNQILLRDAKVPEQKQEVRDDVLICQMMWENLGQQMIYVVIPYAPQIRFQASSNRRNPEMLLDLIKANAAMRLLQREKIEVEGVSCISATQDDFDRAVRLYGLLNGTSGGQTTKLTKREADLLAVIIQHKWPEFTIPMLQKVTGLSNASIFKAIHGYDSRGTSYTGLLEKCPAIAYTDRTVVCEVDQVTGYSTRRRSNAYTFDRDLYLTWCAGGYVWIDAQIDPDSNPSAPSATFCNPTELSVGIENEIKSSIAEDLSTNTHMYLGTCVSYGKFENTQNNDHHPVQESSSLCESEFSVGQIAISPDQSGIDELNSQKGAGACGTSSRVAEGQNAKLEDRGDFDECDVLQGVQSYGKEYITAVGFDPHHFKKLDSLDSRPCSSCGKKGDSWHIEKITPRRRKDPSVEPYTLCRRCWQKTVRKHQETCIPLPGMISIESLEEVRNEIGRCSICNLEKAMWRDRSRDVKVCEYCYQRLARVEGCGVVGG